jgi:hypothetical protein
MCSDQDQAKHQSLVAELVELFQAEGFVISGADGVEGFFPPIELRNDGYGDQEDKIPDVYAYDEKEKRYIIGEAKTGDSDLETEHSLTQYNVFLDQIHPTTHSSALVYFILPSKNVVEFNSLITHYIHRDLWKNLVVVQSKHWLE